MTTRETPFPAGTPCWVDLFSSDPQASKAFYGELFGWTFLDSGGEFGGYVTCQADGRAASGLMTNDGSSGTPDGWTTYLAVDDAEASVERAAAAGAQVVAPAMPVGDLGAMAVLVDPAGAVFGLWQSGEHFGFARYNEPGTVGWDELHTKDFATATTFYADLLGWDYEVTGDSDEFRYRTAQVDGLPVAGVMDAHSYLTEQVPSHWAVYFDVADIDASVALVEKLGGSVVRAPEDTPFGRLADVTDATGAPFKLHQAPPES